MTTIDMYIISSSSIPDLYRFIVTPRCNASAIRRPGHRCYLIYMAAVSNDSICGGGIPNQYFAPGISRHNMGPIGRPCNAVNIISMTTVSNNMFSSESVPDLHCLIPATRCNTFASRGPYYRSNKIIRKRVICMTFIDEDTISRRSVPDLCSVSTGGNILTVRRPSYSKYALTMTVVKKHLFACKCAPYFYNGIVTSRGNMSPIRRPGHCPHNISMASIDQSRWP